MWGDDMLNEIVQLIEKKIRLKGSCVIAIDGRCGAGKTTIAKLLTQYFDCNVFHADDFYIPMEKRKEGRIGNIDCERLLNEVLKPLEERRGFSYRPFCCMEGVFLEDIKVETKSVAIIEGSYSCLSSLFGFYDLHIFVDADKAVQQQRLLQREGEEKLKAFNDKWIPMEERYFAAYEVKYKCEIYYKTSV